MTWPHTLQPAHLSHDCRGDDCRRCNRRTEAAEDEADWGFLDHGDDMDDRADREASWH